jgi:Protein of unknown function (DUF2690)
MLRFKILFLMVLGLLLTAIFSASAAPREDPTRTAASTGAALAVGCTWDACTGKAPDAMGCQADKQVLYQSIPGDLIGIEFYYSPSCRAAWAEFFGQCTTPSCGLQIWYTPQFGFVEQGFTERIVNGGNEITPMVSWNNSVKACSTDHPNDPQVDRSPDGGRNDGGDECTQWF